MTSDKRHRGRACRSATAAKERPLISQCGAALIVALWTIALLSLLVLSFGFDAMIEGKIDSYVRNRRHVDYLTQSGIAIAEMIISSYKEASAVTEDELSAQIVKPKGALTNETADVEADEVDESVDPWLSAKLSLQGGNCLIEDYPIDAANPDDGTVTVEIKTQDGNKWPINQLVNDTKFDDLWKSVFTVMFTNMDSNVEEYMDSFVDSWHDWRDEDHNASSAKYGAEQDYYDDLEKPYQMRDGEIVSIEELKKIKAVLDCPALFEGGIANPEERHPERQLQIFYGLKEFFDVWGEDVKINVNSAGKTVLLSVPGLFDPSDDDPALLVDALLRERDEGSAMEFDPETDSAEKLLYKDWNDFQSRMNTLGFSVSSTAQQYLTFGESAGYFQVKVTGKFAGLTHTIVAVLTLTGDEVRCIRWQEDP